MGERVCRLVGWRTLVGLTQVVLDYYYYEQRTYSDNTIYHINRNCDYVPSQYHRHRLVEERCGSTQSVSMVNV